MPQDFQHRSPTEPLSLAEQIESFVARVDASMRRQGMNERRLEGEMAAKQDLPVAATD
jgi:hypothetical protein